MVRQPGFFDVEERLRELSAKGDDLERIAALVDFAVFRAELERAAPRSDGPSIIKVNPIRDCSIAIYQAQFCKIGFLEKNNQKVEYVVKNMKQSHFKLTALSIEV